MFANCHGRGIGRSLLSSITITGMACSPEMIIGGVVPNINMATQPFLRFSDKRHGTFLKSTWRHEVCLKN